MLQRFKMYRRPGLDDNSKSQKENLHGIFAFLYGLPLVSSPLTVNSL